MNRLKGLAATLLIGAILIGLPALLLALGLPTLFTRHTNLLDVLLRPDDGTLFLAILWILGWLVWAYLAATVTAEVIGTLRHARPRHLPGLPHGWAHHLVATAALLFVATSSLTPTPAQATPAPAGTTAQPTSEAPSPPVAPDAVSALATSNYVVQPGDTLWRIAQQQLGAGERYPEIVTLNQQLLGGKPDFLRVGWALTLPIAETPQPTQVVVQRGDTLTKIAARRLGDPTRWPEIYQASTHLEQPDGRCLTDPDQIDIGWTLNLPTNLKTTASDPAPVPAPAPEAAPAANTQEPTSAPTEAAETTAENVEPAANSDVTIPQAADESVDEDDQDGPVASWVVAGLAGGGLLCGSLAIGLRKRRAIQAQHRRPGRAIQPTPAAVAPIEKTITTRPQARIDVEELDALLWWTAHHLTSANQPVPEVIAVSISATEIQLHLSGHQPAPAPWQNTPEGDVWLLERNQKPLIGPDRTGAPAWPQLTTIGISDDGTTWLLNLETAGVLTLTGDPTNTNDLLRHIVAELTLNPWARDVRIDCLNTCPELVDLDPTKIRHHTTADVVRSTTEDPINTRTLLAETDAHTLAEARASNAGYGLWPSRALIIGSTPPTVQVDHLIGDILSGPDRQTGVSLLLTQPNAESQGVELHLTSGGRVRVPSLDWDLIAVGLTSDEAQGCVALIAAADNLDDTPIPAATPDTDATGNLTGSSQRRELSGANPGSLLPEPDDVYLTHTATTREDLQTLAPAVPLTVADRLGEADPTLDHDLVEWQAGQGPRPRLSVLGPIYARVGTGGNPLAAAKRRAFYTELLAYLWSQPHGATTAQVTDALNITEERARRDLSKLREWLGTNPATGQPHLPQARKSQTGRLLGIGIYEVNDLLVDADLFKRLRTRALIAGEAGIADLDTALTLVQGTPFTDIRPTGGAWLIDTGLPQHLTCAIVDTAHLITTHALASSDTNKALWAASIANQAAPHEITPQLDLAATAEALGQRAQAQHLVKQALNPDPDEAPIEHSRRTEEVLTNRHWKSA